MDGNSDSLKAEHQRRQFNSDEATVQIAVLGNPDSWYGDDLERAARELGHRAVRIDFRRLAARVETGGCYVRAGETEFSAVEAVIVRTMPPGSLEQVVYRMDTLGQLEASGVVLMNPPRAIEAAVDKYVTTCRLSRAGLSVPETVVCENAEAAMEALESLGGDVVVKPIFGSEGRGIVRVSDVDLALRTFRTLERIQSVLYVQRYVEHRGFDVRVLVLDGRILGAMRRISIDDFRTNVSRSARAERHTATPVEEEYALRAAAAVGTRFAGVDLLYDREERCYVIEVNAVPGWRAFRRVTGCDVARCVINGLAPIDRLPAALGSKT
jgi:ribosomal protein S6--L-glutamate ligase